jgi:asparagine synthase (glutamine-hydrolysing)
MSGFVALFDRNGAGVDSERLQTMLNTIDHRGPDGRDTWFDDRVALGHQQLRSTPESQFDEQPYREDGLVVAGDFRIDNRDELLAQLSFSVPVDRIPDSHILLRAYQRWGSECVDHLVGAFAFAIWDTDTQTVFCARDFFGVKPLYYYMDDDWFAVASEAKAILSLPFVSTEVNDLMIGNFLTKNFADEEITFFDSLSRLPSAHATVVGADHENMWQFWRLDPTRTLELESDAAYERRFRELFEQAVQCRLRTNGPIGTTLSGGIDSSSITVVARDLLPAGQPLHAFSNVYDEAPSSDEREYIETVTSRAGIKSHYVFCDDTGLFPDVDAMRRYFDQPIINNMHFAQWERAKRARKESIQVMLGGTLGDQAIGYGLGLLPQLFLTGRWRYLHREISAMSDVVGAPKWSMFRRHVLRHVIPNPVLRLRRRLHGEPILLEKVNPFLNPDFVEEIGLHEQYRADQIDNLGVVWSARRDAVKGIQSGRKPAVLEISDQTANIFGVEPRYPFADKRLVEYTLAIPSTQQFRDGWTRSIARRALDDLLPKKIQWRTWKTLMDEAVHNALSHESDRLEALLENPDPVARYFHMDELRAAYERLEYEPRNRDARRLWEALSLWVWLKNKDCVGSLSSSLN